MHWEFLTLIPLLIAALLFATLRPWSARRGLQLVLLLLFAALAAVVLLGGGRPVGGRAVIVLDQSTNDPHTAAAAREAVARLAELGVVAYDLVLIDPEAETPAEEPPDERPWLRTHLDPVHIAPRKTISPEAAVGYACRRLAARRFRWLTAWCSADRVVVLATADARWRLMPPPAIAPLLQVAAEAGAVLDLVEPRIEDRAAKLTILTAGKLLPANTPLNDRPETLRLRLVSPQLADLEGEARFLGPRHRDRHNRTRRRGGTRTAVAMRSAAGKPEPLATGTAPRRLPAQYRACQA